MVEKISNFLIVTLTKLIFMEKIYGIENLPDKGPYIVAVNHASYFDHFIIQTLFKLYKKQNVYFLTKKEAFDSFLSRKWHLSMGCIPLNRGGTATSSFRTVIKHLKEEKILCIYPEGTRSPTGKMYEGKQGAIRMAMASNVPILPIGIKGTFDILPRKRFWPNFRKSVVNIGEIIKIEPTKDKEVLKKHHDELMNKLKTLSKSAEFELYPLPQEKELYKAELLQSAHEWNERGIRNYPNDIFSRKALHKRSIYICEEVLKEDPMDCKAHFEKGRAIGRLGMDSKNFIKKIFYFYKARQSLKLAIEADSTFAPSYYALGVWHMEMPTFLGGSPKKALDFYRKANDQATEVYIQIGLAKTLIELGKVEEAKMVLLVLLTDTPTKSNVDSRRKVEALAMVMRIDPKFKLEDRMMNLCLLKSQNG